MCSNGVSKPIVIRDVFFYNAYTSRNCTRLNVRYHFAICAIGYAARVKRKIFPLLSALSLAVLSQTGPLCHRRAVLFREGWMEMMTETGSLGIFSAFYPPCMWFIRNQKPGSQESFELTTNQRAILR